MLGATAHRTIYLVLLTLLGGTMVCSTWAANLVWVLMAANWVLEGRWHEKWQRARRSRLLHGVLAVVGLYALSGLWSDNRGEWLNQLELVLPLLAVPAVVLTTRPPSGQARRTILWLYTGMVVVVSLIGTVRLLTIDGLPYRQAVPYISHIRFALNCCLATVVCLTECGRSRWRYGAWLLAAWLLAYVLLMRSYTAVGILAALSLLLALRSAHRWRWTTAWGLCMLGGIGFLLAEVHGYYRLVPLATGPLKAYTAGGRPYHHEQDGFIESGNYVNNYLCLEEMRAEWTRRGGGDLGTPTPEGYTCEANLIRYLNALGLTKDSVGVASLSRQQMEEVAHGVPNPVYAHGNPLRRMVHVMLFEYENYRCYNAVAGFTMLQRLELWKTGWRVVLQHPWVGTGSGDLADAMERELQATNSPLQGHGMYPHNQYLTWLAMFGQLGAALLTFLFARALPALRGQSTLTLAWTLTLTLSCLTESTLGTLAGCLLCCWFMAFRTTGRRQ